MAAVLIGVLVSVVAPLWFVSTLWRRRYQSRLGWMLNALYAAAFVVLVLLVGRWDIAGHYTRWLLALLLVMEIVMSWRRHRKQPLRVAADRPYWRRHGGAALSFIALVALLAWIVPGYFPPRGAVELHFPLEDGRFNVGQGGDHVLLNYHNPNRAQRHALDITALGRAGFRARGLLPGELGRYEIYGKTVASPCAGKVLAAMDGLGDQTPPNRDSEYPAGNHVVIDCEGVHVLLAHLREGSVRVDAGEQVAIAQAIGAVGNSGNTTEPHLHIHAVQANAGDVLEGVGVPITFGGRFLARNAIVEGARYSPAR